MSLRIASILACLAASSAGAQTLVGSYFFNDTLSSSVPGAPDMTAINPLGLNSFQDDVVFGRNRRVYHVNGNATPVAQQAGLSLAAGGLVNPFNYSVEMVIKFDERDNAWRLILDNHNRLSDLGLYLDTANRVVVYDTINNGPTPLLAGNYFHLVVTVQPGIPFSAVTAYVNGTYQFNVVTDIMDLVNNQNLGGILHIFADNVQSGGMGEFSDASIAAFRLYNGALTSVDAEQLYAEFSAPACPCDLNVDAIVDDADFVIFAAAYNILDCADPTMDPGCPADFNLDGVVDDQDFVIFAAAYNEVLCP